jgi:hypothetical protein
MAKKKKSVYDGALIVTKKVANSSFNENYSIPNKGEIVVAYNDDGYSMKVGNGKDIFNDLNALASTNSVSDGSGSTIDLSAYAKKKDLNDYVTIDNLNGIVKTLNTKIDNIDVDIDYATTETAGTVKVDGKTIKINEDGVISAVVSNSSGEGGSSTLTEEINPNQTVGGVSSSNSYPVGTSLEDIIRDILVKEIAPTMSVTLTPASGYKESGTTVELTKVSVSITKNSASSIENIKIYNGSSLIKTITGSSSTSYSATVSESITEDTDINVVVTYKKSTGSSATISNTSSYKFTYKNYSGVLSTVADVTSANIKELTSTLVGSKSQTVSYTTSNQLMVFAYPASFGDLTSIVDTSTGYSLTWTKKTVTINKVSYICYYSDIGKVTNYKVKFN